MQMFDLFLFTSPIDISARKLESHAISGRRYRDQQIICMRFRNFEYTASQKQFQNNNLNQH